MDICKFVNDNHQAVRVAEQQNQALEMVSRANKTRAEKEAARKKKKKAPAGWRKRLHERRPAPWERTLPAR